MSAQENGPTAENDPHDPLGPDQDTKALPEGKSPDDRHVPRSIKPGSTIGHHRFIREIGAGGMGIVYLVENLKLRRKTALKILHSLQNVEDGQARRRFLREAILSANVDHPNVVPVFDVGLVHGHDYIEMAYVEGPDLEDWVARNGPLDVPRATAVVLGIARGLRAAHEKRTVHRDMKPRNVLLDPKGDPRITDFGLAKSLESLHDSQQSVTALGTPGYSAPEQWRKGEVDFRADIYSLGAIFFFLLTGKPPFAGSSAQGIIGKQLSASIDWDFPEARDVPAWIRHLISRMTRIDPNKRPDSVDLVIRELEAKSTGAAGARTALSAPRARVRTYVEIGVGAAVAVLLAALVLSRFLYADPAEQAFNLLERGQVDAAEALFQGLTRSATHDVAAQGWAGLGMVEVLREDYDKAASHAAEALRMDSANPTAHLVQGYVFLQDGRYEEAKEHCRLALEAQLAHAWLEKEAQSLERRLDEAVAAPPPAPAHKTETIATAADLLTVLEARAKETGLDLPKPPDRPADVDPWTSPELSVTVLRVVNPDGSDALGVMSRLITALQKQNLRVVQSADDANLLLELVKGTGRVADPDRALRLGELISAAYVLSVQLEQDRSLLQVVKTRTSEIASESLEIPPGLPPDVSRIAEKARALVESMDRFQARVAANAAGEVVLNAGARHGASVGVRLDVFRDDSGEAHLSSETQLGRIELTHVEPETSRGKLVNGTLPLPQGAKAREVVAQ